MTSPQHSAQYEKEYAWLKVNIPRKRIESVLALIDSEAGASKEAE